MKEPSRYRQGQPLTLERLKDFVALDILTAQVPLIEVTRSRGIRIWVAYDLTRTYGTYVEVNRNGCVRTITMYYSGHYDEKINRPANSRDTGRVQKEKKPHTAKRKARRHEAVSKREKLASTK